MAKEWRPGLCVLPSLSLELDLRVSSIHQRPSDAAEVSEFCVREFQVLTADNL